MFQCGIFLSQYKKSTYVLKKNTSIFFFRYRAILILLFKNERFMLLNKMAQQNAQKFALILEYEIAFKIDQGIQQGKNDLE